MTAPDVPAVVDDRANDRFVMERDGALAELVYEVDGADLLLLHTEVPDRFRGQGVGGQLVRAALDRARADGLSVVPWCPFARQWLEQHPDASAAVTVDFQRRPPGLSG